MAGSATFTPGGVTQGNRVTRSSSTALLHEWASLQPWDYPPVYELRLGPTPLSAAAGVLTPEIEGMLRVRNRYADLVGVTPSEVQIIEAKMVFDPGAISQVQHYVDLAHNTPLLRNYPGRIIQPVILVAFDDPVLRQKAEAAGIRVILYTPPWAGEWLVKRYGGKQAPTASNSSSE